MIIITYLVFYSILLLIFFKTVKMTNNTTISTEMKLSVNSCTLFENLLKKIIILFRSNINVGSLSNDLSYNRHLLIQYILYIYSKRSYNIFRLKAEQTIVILLVVQ